MEIIKTLILLNITGFMGTTNQDFVKVHIVKTEDSSDKYFIENVGSMDEIEWKKFDTMIQDTKNYFKA